MDRFSGNSDVATPFPAGCGNRHWTGKTPRPGPPARTSPKAIAGGPICGAPAKRTRPRTPAARRTRQSRSPSNPGTTPASAPTAGTPFPPPRTRRKRTGFGKTGRLRSPSKSAEPSRHICPPPPQRPRHSPRTFSGRNAVDPGRPGRAKTEPAGSPADIRPAPETRTPDNFTAASPSKRDRTVFAKSMPERTAGRTKTPFRRNA